MGFNVLVIKYQFSLQNLKVSCIFQERGRISKSHMTETVEELKKFNARRKLKVITQSTVFGVC